MVGGRSTTPIRELWSCRSFCRAPRFIRFLLANENEVQASGDRQLILTFFALKATQKVLIKPLSNILARVRFLLGTAE